VSTLEEVLASIRPGDSAAAAEAREWQDRLTKPRGALGQLEEVSVRLAALAGDCPPPLPEPAAVAVFAGDHGVHAQGVTPWPQEVTGQMVANFLAGGAAVNVLARQADAAVVVVDVGIAAPVPGDTSALLDRRVRPGTDDMTLGAAMTRDDALAAIGVGIEVAQRLIEDGARCLIPGDMGIANTTAAAALVAAFSGRSPAEVTGRGTGIDDATLAHKVDVVERALGRTTLDIADPIGVLAAVGGLEHAALVGYLLAGSARRVPVLLDGVASGAAALVASALAPAAVDAWFAGHRSVEPGASAALQTLGLTPLVDLGLRLGEGTGALLALPSLSAAARILREMATFDAAGVSEKA
jgi:nicotinate-nucleotide--dimethylbenzimidazole phosphoribosyltransferase